MKQLHARQLEDMIRTNSELIEKIALNSKEDDTEVLKSLVELQKFMIKWVSFRYDS